MPDRHDDDVVRRFAEACRAPDIAVVSALLDPGAVAVCDGGGAVPAPALTHGAEDVARLVTVLLGGREETELTLESVNGRTGLALRRAGRADAVASVVVADAKVAVVWIVLNPAKLSGWHRR